MRHLALAVVAVLALPASASAASFDTTPPATSPSGTTSFPFTIRSTGGSGDNGWVAYKLPTETGWHRCQHPNPVSFSLGALADGTYTVYIADDINVDWWAAQGQLYSGHTAGCSTQDAPATQVSSFTFTVAAPVVTPPSPQSPVPTPPAPVVTPTVPAVAVPGPSVDVDCNRLRSIYRDAQSREVTAKRAYKRRRTAARRRALLKVQATMWTARKSYYTNCS
jgi:hypothetical protein